MNIEKLIENLSGDLRPVKKLWSPEKRFLIWFCFQALLVGLLLKIFGPFQIEWSDFSAEIFLLLSTILASGYLALTSVIPGRNKNISLKLVLLPLFLTITILVFKIVSTPAGPTPHLRNLCFLEIFIFALVPMAHLIYLLQKGFFINKAKTFRLASVSAAFIPAAFMHVICSHHPIHTLVFHLAPAGIAASTMAFLIYKFSEKIK